MNVRESSMKACNQYRFEASLLTVEVFLLGVHALGLCRPDDRLLHV